MAYRRCLNALTRHGSTFLFSNSESLQPLKITLTQFHSLSLQQRAFFTQIFEPTFDVKSKQSRSFCSKIGQVHRPGIEGDHCSGSDFDDEVEPEDDEEEEFSSDEDVENESASNDASVQRTYSVEEKIEDAAKIGYKVIAPLKRSEREALRKPYEPVFAVVQIGSHQFKVSNGDCIYTEKLKFCEVNDKLILDKVLLLGSKSQTMVGRPILPDAAVHAVVEEHALDAKVIIFKKEKRKNYRRTNGHRQELTRLRIIDIEGIEKPEMPQQAPKVVKKFRTPSKTVEKVAVPV